MAVLTHGERLQTMDTFISHWNAVNLALAPGELALNGPYTLACGFVPHRAAVSDSMEEVVERENLWSVARSDRDRLRGRISARFSQFRAAVTALLPGSTYLVSIPKKPYPASSAGEWSDACTRVASLWALIDANTPPVAGFVPPLTLAGGYARAQFVADADELRDAYETVRERAMDLRMARALREEIYAAPKARMVHYRLAVLGSFAAGNELVLTLPSVTP
ncbi:MAG: hypothetical protein ABIV13_00410 [Fimbriimonadales bacterium]